MSRNWLKIAGGTLGAGILLIMLFANQLGMDNNPVWGIKRYLIFFVGFLILAVSLFHRKENFIGRAFNTRTGQLHLASGLLGASILFIYIWFTSVGLWTIWPNETSYYDLLASAFRNGDLALGVKPDPALLTLENLYEPGSREGIPMLWDATLYKGNYYLYWGPAPALFLAIIKLFYEEPVGDKVITFAFAAGTLFFTILLILEIWKRYFAEIPRWAVLAGMAFAGLVNPILFILIEGRIYEAAIIAGQFFLIGGLYWLVTGFIHPSSRRSFMAGLFFALAVGSRTTLTPAVAVLSLVLFLWAVKSQRGKALPFITAFALPLILGAVGYAWYNYARFDSFTEFGYRYQLTSYNLYESLDETFSLAYIPPNVYKTLFNPLERRVTFPYFFPTRWVGPDWLANGNYPKFYLLLAEGITGIFIASPFMVFAFLTTLNKREDSRWIAISLAGSAFSIFFMLQIFFFTTMRYMLDLIPTLSLLAVAGFWQGLIRFKDRPIVRRILIMTGLALLLYSIAIGLLLPVSGHLESFRVFNPDLLKNMTWIINNIIPK